MPSSCPSEALVPEEDGYKVFVVDARGTAVAREVKIGGRTATKVEITEGLAGGETVVTKGAFGVEDSATVGAARPRETVSDSRASRTACRAALVARRRCGEPAAFRLSGRRAAVRRGDLGGAPAAVGDLSRAAVPAHHDRRAGLGARRPPGGVRDHPADRGSRGRRARRHARAVQLHPRCERDLGQFRAGHRHGVRAAADAGPCEPAAWRPAGWLEIEVERPSPALFPIISYNLEGGDPATMYDIARYQIRPVLSRVPGVGRVDVQASDVREIEVVADPVRLAEQGLSYEDLASAIRQRDLAECGWAGGAGLQAVPRRHSDRRRRGRRTSRTSSSGRGFRVRDVATVELGTEDHVRIIAGDGRPAALLNMTRQIGGNTVAIADSVERAAVTLRRTLPAGVTLKAVYDQASLVREATKSVRDAMLDRRRARGRRSCFVFLRRARITAISAASIPLTLAITVFVMSLVGQTFNLMTLGAMAIAIGLVIDDAVVVTENIVRHLGSRPIAARRSARRCRS